MLTMNTIESSIYNLKVDLYTSNFFDAEAKINRFRAEHTPTSLTTDVQEQLSMLEVETYVVSGKLAEALDLSINLQRSNDISDNTRLLLILIIIQTLKGLGRASEINAIIETSLDDECHLKTSNGWLFLDILSFYTFNFENLYNLFEKQLKNIEEYLGIILDRNDVGDSISTTRSSWLLEKKTLNDIRSSKLHIGIEDKKRLIMEFISIAKFKPHILEAERLLASL